MQSRLRLLDAAQVARLHPDHALHLAVPDDSTTSTGSSRARARTSAGRSERPRSAASPWTTARSRTFRKCTSEPPPTRRSRAPTRYLPPCGASTRRPPNGTHAGSCSPGTLTGERTRAATSSATTSGSTTSPAPAIPSSARAAQPHCSSGRASRYAAEEGLGFDFEGSIIRGVERFFRAFAGVPTPYSVVRTTRSRALRFGTPLKRALSSVSLTRTRTLFSGV